jgi:hypothetical protein
VIFNEAMKKGFPMGIIKGIKEVEKMFVIMEFQDDEVEVEGFIPQEATTFPSGTTWSN